MTNKKICVICLLLGVLASHLMAGEKVTIVKDREGKEIQVSFSSTGIIESIGGTVGVISPTPLTITMNLNFIKIYRKYSRDKCFNIQIERKADCLGITKTFLNKETLSYDIKFNHNGNILDDGIIAIKEQDSIIKSFFEPKANSFLPCLEYIDGVVYQLYKEMDNRNFKYEYFDERKKEVACSQILGGYIWEQFMIVTLKDIKNNDKLVNLINYLILYCYDSIVGTIYFPLLVDLPYTEKYLDDLVITADSYFKRFYVKYLPENLNDKSIGKPWVEGKFGSGVGSKLTVESKSNYSKLIISNGFNSKKSKLFYNNNRVKEIKITDLNNPNNTVTSTLPDSTEPFVVGLPFTTNKVEITIESVYKGKIYNNTCMNYILAK